MKQEKTLRKTLLPALLVLGLAFASANILPEDPSPFIGENPLYDDNDAYCTGEFQDVDSDFANVTVNWSVSSNEVYGENFSNVPNGTMINSTLDSSNFSEGQEVLCNVTVDDQEDDDVVWELDNVITDTFPPAITGPVFHNYSSEHGFNVSAVLLDRESDDEIRECWLNASDGDGNSVRDEMDLRRYYGDSDQARCYYSDINEFITGFEVLEDINVTMYANDSGGDVTNSSLVNPVPNSKPRVYNVRPSSDATISSDSVELQARVEDGDGEDLEVKFIDETGSRGTATQTGVSSGGDVSTTWNNLQQLTTYYWRLNVSDGYQTFSERFRFRNQFPSQFRVNTRFETPYTSVLVSPNTSRVVRYSVYNDASSSRDNLVTTTYGVDSVISATGSASSTSYDLSPGERKFFDVEIDPDSEGAQELVVATKSSDYSINSTEKLSVYVDDRPGAAAEVPGLGAIQLIFLLLASTLFYSARL